MKNENAENFNWNDKTILLVNKHEINYFVVKEMLSEIIRTNLIWKTNCENSVEFCKTNKSIDLVLIDLVFPYTTGFETARQLIELNNKLSIIGLIDRTHFTNLNRKEFLSFIYKPIILTEFISAIETIFLDK